MSKKTSKTLKTAKKSVVKNSQPIPEKLSETSPSKLTSQADNKDNLEAKKWKPWGDHPAIVAILLICAVIGVIPTLFQHLFKVNPENSNTSQEVNVNEIKLGVYVDKSTSVNLNVLLNEKQKIRNIIRAILPDKISTIRFGVSDNLWGVSAEKQEVNTEAYKFVNLKDYCKSVSAKEKVFIGNNEFLKETDKYTECIYTMKRINVDIMIEGVLNTILEKPPENDYCTDFGQLKERIINDTFDFNIIITDGKIKCKPTETRNAVLSKDKTVIVLLVPSNLDKAADSFEKRKTELQKTLLLNNLYIFPIVSAPEEEVMKILK